LAAIGKSTITPTASIEVFSFLLLKLELSRDILGLAVFSSGFVGL